MALNLTQREADEILNFSLEAYSDIRQTFWRNFYHAIFEFLSGAYSVRDMQRVIENTIEIGYNEAALVGWVDGGKPAPLSEDAAVWLASRRTAEQGFAQVMMTTMVQIQGDPDTDPTSEAWRRADGYAATLDAIYANVKAMAAGNKMLTFVGVDGLESCSDCMRYKLQRHRASWWVRHDAVPPNRSFECHGYQCQHVLIDDDGKLFSI